MVATAQWFLFFIFQWNTLLVAQKNTTILSWTGKVTYPERKEDIENQTPPNTKVKLWSTETTTDDSTIKTVFCCAFSLDTAYARSSSPPENGPRLLTDHRVKTCPRTEKSNRASRASQDSRGTQGTGHIRKNNPSPSRHPDQESSQEHWEKGGSVGNRNKVKSTWRPIREVLNVDTVLNELEQRRQQQHDSPRRTKALSQDRGHSEQSREREFIRNRDDRKQKSLMTIYEDEQRHETESHSSVDSESRANQQRGSRLKGGPKTLLRSDTWTIQRTESGYESSDRLSSGSTNPDSPGVDGFVVKDQRTAADAHLKRWDIHTFSKL